MRTEKIKILAEDLGLEDDINELIRIVKHVKGEMAFTKKGKMRDNEKYKPLEVPLKKKISARIEVVLPEYSGYQWSFGRLGDSSCYITIYNPEWK